MNALLPAILVCLSTQVYHTLAQIGQCLTPQLDNGVVEGLGDGGSFFKGEFRCNAGFTLSGPTMLKCRNGVWSGSMPVCSVFGCDPKNLPNFVNGRKQRVKGTRDSVFKYKCNRGFRLFGPKNVYCTKNGWKLDEIPVCARFGCSEEELLGNGIPHGHKRSMFQGAAYKFYCDSGSLMEGNTAVYCDGYSWNGTKPECLVPPATPELSIELDGVGASDPLASVGQQLKLVCKARGGNPFPAMAFMLKGERVEADYKKMLKHGGYNAVHTFTVESQHANLDMSCIAENKMTSIPVASNHQILNVKFGPSSTYIQGAEMVIPDSEVEYSCTSDESNPASEITVKVTDQDGNEIAVEVTKPPNMKGNIGFASALQFKFQVLSHFRSVLIECESDNGVGQASTRLTVAVMYPPSNMHITGPDHLVSVDDESEPNNIFTCSTDESNPAADIVWVIETGGVVETIPEHSTAVETTTQGHGWKKISTLSLSSQGTAGVKVHCVATIGDLGFSKKSDELEVNLLGLPGEVSIIGPEILLLNSPTEFLCITQAEDTESLVFIHVSSLNGEPVSFLTESDNTISVTVQEPLEGIIVECFAKNLAGSGPVQAKRVDVQYPPLAQVKDLSVQLTGVEDGSEVLEDYPLEVTCSVLSIAGLTKVNWYVDQKMVHPRDSLVPDGQGNMVSSFRWWPRLGDSKLECVPEVEGNIFAGSAAVSFEVMEEDYGYGEDFYLDDDYEEEYREPSEEYLQEETLEVAEDSKTEKSVDSLYEDDSNKFDDAWDVDNYEEDENIRQENNLYEEKNVNQKNTEHALDNHEENAVKEDLFDTTEQKQSFAAAEPGPAVLSHDSDSRKHVSADLSGHKSLYSSSGMVCSFNIFFGIFISSISRLIC